MEDEPSKRIKGALFNKGGMILEEIIKLKKNESM